MDNQILSEQGSSSGSIHVAQPGPDRSAGCQVNFTESHPHFIQWNRRLLVGGDVASDNVQGVVVYHHAVPNIRNTQVVTIRKPADQSAGVAVQFPDFRIVYVQSQLRAAEQQEIPARIFFYNGKCFGTLLLQKFCPHKITRTWVVSESITFQIGIAVTCNGASGEHPLGIFHQISDVGRELRHGLEGARPQYSPVGRHFHQERTCTFFTCDVKITIGRSTNHVAAFGIGRSAQHFEKTFRFRTGIRHSWAQQQQISNQGIASDRSGNG